MSRFLRWKQILLLIIVQYTFTTVSTDLDFLTGDDEARAPTSVLFEAGSNAKKLWNGEQSPKPLQLSQSHRCKDYHGQAPNRRRRVRRQNNDVCFPDYFHGPETVQTNKLPTKPVKASIEQVQDKPQQKSPETPSSMEPASLPILGETLVGPGPDPNICKNPDRPIPLCHSGVDAVYSATLPWIADRLPYSHAISTQLSNCRAPDVLWCCAGVNVEPSPTFYFMERTILVGISCEVQPSGAELLH